jgi:tRNA dimethylallyltransferase
LASAYTWGGFEGHKKALEAEGIEVRDDFTVELQKYLWHPGPTPHSILLSPHSAAKLLVIVGPTASGKTALAIDLAQKFDGEIVCADSRTVYKYLDIGTAKPTPQEQATVPHHLLDVVDPDEPFTVADFKKLAEQAIQDIQSRGKLPILVGGSGLYVDAVIYDYRFSSAAAPKDPQNPRHLDASVEQRRSKISPHTLVLGLEVPRDVLKQRIAARVDQMVDAGFLDEVTYVAQRYPNSKALDAPGYKAFRQYQNGELTLEQAKALFVQNDYQLAKRQMTWFRRNSEIYWFDGAVDALEFATNSLIDTKNTGKNSAIIRTP